MANALEFMVLELCLVTLY